MDVDTEANRKDRPLTRADIEQRLQEVGSSDKLDLSYQNLYMADLSHLNLAKANLFGANLVGTNLSNITLSGADLNHANLIRANLSGADLRLAKLIEANLIRTNLSNADLNGADLSNADLSEATLNRANLTDAHLTGANLVIAKLIEANLIRTNLSNAALSYADLRNADVRGANLNNARVGSTVFGNIDLRSAKGLETVRHQGPSTIGIDTIYQSGGNIPEAFLKGAGIDDTFITYIRSLVNKPIEYYSCFISYSSKDQDFAERLYSDLQSKNVRCWYAPHSMNIGDKIRPRIDESIRLYDKLLVILSKNSVASSWVGYEVESALNKEPKGVPNVLYPIRLDNAVLICTASWAQDIRETRHIGDFERWKDHDHYQEGFKRLLRALTTKQPTKET